MKKTISVIMALIIAVSCCTVFGVNASDDAVSPAAITPIYLLGDADLDGEISILDATCIQRDLAAITKLSGLQKALADTKGEGVNITCATDIQRYLAGIDTSVPIGEPAGDENEGVIYAEPIMAYAGAGDTIISQEDKVYFSTAYPGIAFITDSEIMLTYCQHFGYQAEDMDILTNEEMHYYDLPNGSAVIFDHGNMEMIFSDYSTTLSVNGGVPFNPYGPSAGSSLSLDPNKPSMLFEIRQSSKYYGSDPCVATFAYDEVPMLKSEDSILLPLQVMSDFFLSPKSSFIQYNGKSVYSFSKEPNLTSPALWKQYVEETEKLETVSPVMAQVNYYELCNVLEARYGLRQAHDIDSFDSYFRRRGLRDEFLSGNLERIQRAEEMMGVLLFEDFHSATNTPSPFFGGSVTPDPGMYSPTYINRRTNFLAISEKRSEVLGDNVAPYERRGDTVFITFDEFNLNGVMSLYSDGFEPDPESGDTIELFAYALRRLQNEDSDAKNVVVDISCNGGGTSLSCGYVMDALIGTCIICLHNPNTNALSQTVTKFDLNLDGVIDENDISMKAMGKNIAVVMSNASFSCGNLLPCALNSLDENILLMGQTSGGGACEVGYISTLLGSTMQISSEAQLVTMKNGYIRDIDSGVDPKIPLSTSRLFDRDHIVDLVDEFFG